MNLMCLVGLHKWNYAPPIIRDDQWWRYCLGCGKEMFRLLLPNNKFTRWQRGIYPLRSYPKMVTKKKWEELK